MYLLNVNARAVKSEMDKVKTPHVEWVKEGINKGWFLFAGPKSDKPGGLILVKSIMKSELLAYIELDPYVINKVASYEVIDFNISLAAECLGDLSA